jgi:hypothetical protein
MSCVFRVQRSLVLGGGCAEKSECRWWICCDVWVPNLFTGALGDRRFGALESTRDFISHAG